MSSFIKIRPVGAECFHADRRTDTTKLIPAFRDFANASKSGDYNKFEANQSSEITRIKFLFSVYFKFVTCLSEPAYSRLWT